MLRFLFSTTLIILLTILTQVGGLLFFVFRFVLYPGFPKSWKSWWISTPLFVLFYALNCAFLVPQLASLWNREPLPLIDDQVAPGTWLTTLCNRQYVDQEMAAVVYRTAEEFQKEYPGGKIIYLDANFPLIDGFPLFPHLSHNDGKKLDLAFVYSTPNGQILNQGTTWSGYGHYEGPNEGEVDQVTPCLEENPLYSFMEYLSLFPLRGGYTLDEAKTSWIIEYLVKQDQVEKIFIEPHLKTRLRVRYEKVRFHGCHSVRHDDHIHFQLR
ncbi:hypothetical protein KFE98_12665 [bacterium SCSIO 12741]|nr:hypothetical protein KFE98_12665 [bacterium SCSIO 12741]